MSYGMTQYNVTGEIKLYKDWPKTVIIHFEPHADIDKITMEYDVKQEENNYILTATYNKGDALSKINGNLLLNHKYDWALQTELNTPLKEYKTFTVNAKMFTPNLNNMSFQYESTSPFKGLETTKFGYTFMRKDFLGVFGIYHSLANSLGQIKLSWRMQLLENMALKLAAFQHFEDRFNKDIVADLFYISKNQMEVASFGANFDIDKSLWMFGSNVSVSMVDNDLGVKLDLRVPSQKEHVHSVRGKYMNNVQVNRRKLEYLAKYFMTNSDTLYGFSGEVSFFCVCFYFSV